jgi:hypothetical protein
MRMKSEQQVSPWAALIIFLLVCLALMQLKDLGRAWVEDSRSPTYSPSLERQRAICRSHMPPDASILAIETCALRRAESPAGSFDSLSACGPCPAPWVSSREFDCACEANGVVVFH